MKLHSISSILIAAVAFTACGDSTPADTAETNAANSAQERTSEAPVRYDIDATASKVNWTGTMLGIKKHHGTVNYTDGELVVTNGQLVGGEFVVDLSSINPLDENYEPDTAEQGRRADLVNHLKSPDFFDVENHPTATLRITEASGNTATAEMTIRGKTGTETIRDIQITENNGQLKATGNMTFDRQKYDMKWSTGVQEAVLSDDVEINVELVGRAQAS